MSRPKLRSTGLWHGLAPFLAPASRERRERGEGDPGDPSW